MSSNSLLDSLSFFLDFIFAGLSLSILLGYRFLVCAFGGLRLLSAPSVWLLNATWAMSLACDCRKLKWFIPLFNDWRAWNNKRWLHVSFLLLNAIISCVSTNLVKRLLNRRWGKSPVIFVFGVSLWTCDCSMSLVMRIILSGCRTRLTSSVRPHIIWAILHCIILVFEFKAAGLLLLFDVVKAQLHSLSVSIHQGLLSLHMMIVSSWIYAYSSRFIALMLGLLVRLAPWS